ncbi:FmdE family protein [Chloroflexota bacterium]
MTDCRGEATITSCSVDIKQPVNNTLKHLQPYFELGAKFHGYLSPGLTLGIIMVDLAQELLGPRYLVDAIVETKACLPDAIQLMTPCSYGNGWMQVKNWGKVALTLYDKYQLDGIRISVNLEKSRKYPLIEQWLMRIGNVNKEEVTGEIMRVGRRILSWQRVRVDPDRKIKKAPLRICSVCGEAHPAIEGDLCTRCSRKENYYELADNPASNLKKLTK